MKKLLVAGLAILGSLGVVGAAGAITYESGTPVPVAEIMDFSPSGASMVGMAVTAYFSGTRASETYYWAGSGTTGGGESAMIGPCPNQVIPTPILGP